MLKKSVKAEFNDEPLAKKLQINVIDRVNALYTTTDWGIDEEGRRLINMGFMIKDMIIHTSPTVDQPNHYNSNINTKRSVKAVLDVSNVVII